ncbi:MAG: hypothetical protein P8Z00_05430 [Anaerolineales bacterium]|jgi:hypothetical protein
MSSENARMHVLKMIESGAIDADEGIRLLQDLPQEDEAPDRVANQPAPIAMPSAIPLDAPGQAVTQPDGEDSQTEFDPREEEPVQGTVMPNHPIPEGAERWRAWWMIPFWVGLAITVASSGLLYWALLVAGVGLGFFLALLPFLAGVALMFLTWQARSACWLHLRVHQGPGQFPQTIAISFPLPLRLASWFLSVFHDRLPNQMGQFDRDSLETLIQSLKQSASANTPFYLEVQDDEDGDRVEIFIG